MTAADEARLRALIAYIMGTPTTWEGSLADGLDFLEQHIVGMERAVTFLKTVVEAQQRTSPPEGETR